MNSVLNTYLRMNSNVNNSDNLTCLCSCEHGSQYAYETYVVINALVCEFLSCVSGAFLHNCLQFIVCFLFC